MGSEPRRASLLDADLKFKAEADQDVNTKLKQWLPPLLEADELLQNFGSLLEEPVDEDGNPMIKLPYFDEEDRHRTPAVRNFSIPGKKQIFGSKGWDALFQAAQAARREGTKENQELKEYMLEAQKRLEEKESKKDASFNELYLLLNETPEEAAKRIKRIKETKKRILALRSAMQKTWMSKHGRAVRPELDPSMRLQLREAFDLIDQDGSGAIDVDELEEAFKVLGMKVSRRRVEEMMDDVDEDGSGEVELPEFEQIMTYHLHGGDGSNKDDKGSGVPFHVMATSYRRKRLMDSIMNKDHEAVRGLIEKAQQYRILENEQRAKMISEHLWITTKVAKRIKNFIKAWRKRKLERDHEKALELARLKREQEGVDIAELKEQQHRKGERDMGFRVENKILDDRTIEKIRIRAKMSSIVAAINAKEKLEEHSLMARRLRPENYYESEDFSDLKKGLDGIFNIKSQETNLAKRMLLAATAHRKLDECHSNRASRNLPTLTWTAKDISKELQFTPRGRTSEIAERLSRGGVAKRPDKLMEVVQRFHSRTRVNHFAEEDLKPASMQPSYNPPRAASCIPWLEGDSSKEVEPGQGIHARVAASPESAAGQPFECSLFQSAATEASFAPPSSKPSTKELLGRAGLGSNKPERSSTSKLPGTYSKEIRRFSQENLENLPAGSLGQGEDTGGQVVRGSVMPMSGLRAHHTKELGTSRGNSHPSRRAFSTEPPYSTSPYKHQSQRSCQMVGQSSPVQFAPHLSAAMPGRVTPLLPEIWSPKDNPAHMSRKCCRRSADLGTKRKEGSAAVNMQSGKKVLEQKRTGPHHGVRCRAGRRCLSTEPPEIDDSSLCAVPSYVVDPYVKQIGIDAARQFVEVMTKTPPQTPQARASASPGGVQVKSFPFEPL